MKTLFVLLGPTASGKTALSLSLARRLASPIINADSRQLYRGMAIGTAAPTEEQLASVRHYFVGTLALDDYYSAAMFERDALGVIADEHTRRDSLLMSGGSMLYIDAVCHGIDNLPTIGDDVRQALRQRLDSEGLAALREELRIVDPAYYCRVDLKNPRRIVHALEIYYQSGRPLSSMLGGGRAQRPFRIVKVGLRRERDELFDRINRRVDEMMARGFLDEARSLYHLRHLNSLNTVGYKELFRHIAGEWEFDMAVERIKKNTRVYAKKQMTWFQRDTDIHWFHPDDEEGILRLCRSVD